MAEELVTQAAVYAVHRIPCDGQAGLARGLRHSRLPRSRSEPQEDLQGVFHPEGLTMKAMHEAPRNRAPGNVYDVILHAATQAAVAVAVSEATANHLSVEDSAKISCKYPRLARPGEVLDVPQGMCRSETG